MRDEFDEEPDTSDSNYEKQLQDNKKVTFGTGYNKDLTTDLTSNTNKFISDNTNFYKKQKKMSHFLMIVSLQIQIHSWENLTEIT